MDTINAYLDCLAAEHKDKVTLIDIGRSHDNQRLTVLKISSPGLGDQPNRRAIWIDGGIHAREWISPAAVIYTLHQLVENYDENRDIVDNFDIYIMPVMNPDGYEYTFTHDRMWRKTRSNPSGYAANSRCVGADPNRNFG
jgi:murein tripeptide amidase MpaA